MVSTGSGDGDDPDEDHFEEEYRSDGDALTDLDRDLLYPDDPEGEAFELHPEDFTDLDDDLLYFHREEDLRDRYGPVGLTVITVVHFLPAIVGLLPGFLQFETAVLAPSIGLDLFFVTGVVSFFSGGAAHLAREYGSRYFLRYALVALVGGSAVYLLTLANAILLPGTYLTSGGTAAGIFPQLNAGIVALSLLGGALVVVRLVYETLRGD